MMNNRYLILQEIVLPRLEVQARRLPRRGARGHRDQPGPVVHPEQFCTVARELVHYAFGSEPGDRDLVFGVRSTLNATIFHWFEI